MTLRQLLLSVLILLPYAVFGLAPMGLLDFPEVHRNHARTGDGAAIEFPGAGIVEVRNSAEWLESAIGSDRFDIDLRVQPASDQATGPARILTSSVDPGERNLMIGQDLDRLIVRMRRPATDVNGMPNIVVPDVFKAGQWVDIRVTFAGDELQILVDGRMAERIPVAPAALQTWSPDYEMALGNELTMDRPWLGNIERANISAGDLRLDLLARENQDGPFLVVREPSPDFGRNTDTVVNFLGFIPLGVLLAMWFRPRRWTVFVLVLLVMASVSAGIEIFQLMLLPLRSPSFLDFELNVLGGAAGLLLATLLTRRKRVPQVAGAPEGAD